MVHHVPEGVTPELAGLVTPMANGVEWSLFDGGVGYNSTVLIQGPGQQGLSQTVICKQAGASLIIVTGTSKDAARLKVAKELGADYVIDVQKEDPLARIMEITGGKGVDVSLDCTAGAGTIPILLGIEALKRKGGIIVAQGEMAQFPNFPLEKFTVKFITMKSARGHSYRACELALRADRVEALPAGEGHHAPVRAEGRRPRHPLGRRQGRARRDPRLADAVGVTATERDATTVRPRDSACCSLPRLRGRVGEGASSHEVLRVLPPSPVPSPASGGGDDAARRVMHRMQSAMTDKATIAIATGDPAGIGPEISLKAALDPAVRAACDPVIVSDARHARAARRCLRHRDRTARSCGTSARRTGPAMR